MKRRISFAAVVAAVAVCVTSIGVAPVLAEPVSGVPVNVVSSTSGFTPAVPHIPLVDSQFGAGASLAANSPTSIALGLEAREAKATSALIRLSLFAPQVDVRLDAVGAPALAVRTDESASTTLLVPITDGAVTLTATGDVDLRVELLASFDPSTAPGVFTALGAPVTRTDTATGLGGSQLSTEPTSLGVTGKGGVPILNVRAAMVTVSVTVPTSTSLLVVGQEIALSAGTSIITTLAQVSASGEIDVALASGTGSARIDVRGYVLGAAQNDSALTVNGSYVPVGDITTVDLAVRETASSVIELSTLADAAYSLVLVEADPATQTTILSVGQELKGRAAGVVVDPSAGTQAQLALVPVDSVAEIRRGSTDVTLQRLGDIVSAESAASTDLAVTLDSPVAGTAIELTDVSTFTLEGTVTNTTASLDSVRIYSGNVLVGIAQVDYQQGVSTWSLELAVPATADYEFRVDAVDRAGTTSQDAVNLSVTLPGTDEVLLSPDTRVIPDEILASTVAITETSLTFGVDPGYVPGNIVIGINEVVAPEGFLRRVVSVQQTSAGWVLTTVSASLVEAIRQGAIDDSVNLMDIAGTTFTPVAGPSDGDTPGLITAPGAIEDVTLFDTTTTRRQAADNTSRQAASNADITLEEELKKGVENKAVFTWDPDDVQKDLSHADSVAKNAARVELTASGGAVLEGKVSLGFALKLVLKIDIAWFWLPNSEVVEFSTVLTRSTEASLTGSVFGEANLSVVKALGRIDFPTIRFVIGPVPVFITSGVDLGFAGELSGQASIEATWGTKVVQDYGFKYSGGTFRNASTEPKVTNTLPVFGDGANWEGNATAAIGPTAVLDISIYDAAGPVIEGAGTLGIDMEADTSGISFEAYLEGKIAIGVQLKVPVIDEVLLEATIAEFESKRWSLIKWSTTWDNVFNGSDPSDGDDETEEGGVSDPNMPRPNPAPEFDASDLRITLYWNNKSDMDIHVVEPDGSRIWYNNRGPTASQGTLDIDSNSNCNVDRPNEPGGIENVYWPNGVAAPTGDYSISVDRYSGCRLPDAQWIVEVWNGTELVLRQTGNTEQAFTITVTDLSANRSAAPAPAPAPAKRVTVTDSVPAPVAVGTKKIVRSSSP